MRRETTVPEPSGSGQSASTALRPLDRSAVERVLARAAELQLLDSEHGEPVLSEAQLIEIGREVGLSGSHLRQAIAEERARASSAPEAGALAALFGGARVSATRTVRGTPAAVLAALEEWIQAEECLRIKRRVDERISWEPVGGLVSWYKISVGVGGMGYQLSRGREVSATAVPVDGERVVVRLEADLSNVRAERVGTGAAVASLNVAGTGVLLALGFLPALALLPAAAGLAGGYAIGRTHRPTVQRAQVALERLLDRIERGERPQKRSLLSSLRMIVLDQ